MLWPILFTWLQQLAETAAFWSCAADAQVTSFQASLTGRDLRHLPAPYAPLKFYTDLCRELRETLQVIGASISSMPCRKHFSTSCFYTATSSSKDTWLVTERWNPKAWWRQHLEGGMLRLLQHLLLQKWISITLATLGHWKSSPLTKVLPTVPLLLSFQKRGTQGHLLSNR